MKQRSENASAPITINEDDAVKFSGDKMPRRCMSMPEIYYLKGIMRCRTLDESLHSTYGAQSETGSNPERKGIEFDKIVIREYGRTVGDNPSCRSGPPVRYVIFGKGSTYNYIPLLT